ncbi:MULTISPECIES: hypothetical protein [unclassified Streptomyces]|uniref:hypothetical protein n=1 Tax=unclassified Streptomyces TaxID=2593676 RepID=UPI0036EB3C89
MTTTPIATMTVEDWEAAQAHLAEHASDSAYVLTALTALNDSDLHHIVLDPDTRTVWWAYDNSVSDEDGWTILHLPPEAAAQMASDQPHLIQDRMDNPEWYAEGNGDLGTDQEALDEYTAILRLSLPVEPDRAASGIKAKRRALSMQDALWQRAYANLVRDLVGNEHGGKTRASRQLGVTDVQIGRIIREDDQRRDQLEQSVREAKMTYTFEK